MKSLMQKRKSKEREQDPPSSIRSSRDTSPQTNYRSFASASEDAETDSQSHPHPTITPNSTGTMNTIDHDASHRGFSTSIFDMFAKPENERVDCCALTCCGMLQSDRDRFLVQGIAPPGPLKRCVVHIMFPIFVFVFAGYGATQIRDKMVNQIVSSVLVLLVVVYFYSQCNKGRNKRVELRKDLLWTKYQMQHNRRQNLSVVLEQDRPDDQGRDQEYYLGQSEWDFSCAHPCCFLGCYSDDRARQDDWTSNRDKNFCSLLWAATMAPICGMHPQLFGLCAVAQEAREIETVLLPPSYRRVDYITMQPVIEYYPAIYKAKCEITSSTPVSAAAADASSSASTRSDSSSARSCCKSCWKLPPLSRLSIRLLQGWAITMIVMLVWSLVGPYYWKYIVQGYVQHTSFEWTDYIVFVATWLQAVGLLAFLTTAANKPKYSELSVDAMIKFFASGFLLSTSLAIFWELVISLILKMTVSLSLAIAGVDVITNENGYTLSGLVGFASTAAFSPFLADTTAAAEKQDFIKVFGRSHPIFYTIILLIDAFIMAALVEELCKYFGYRMVDHPDFFSKQDLEESTRVVYGESEEELEEGRRQRRERPSYSNQRTSLQAQGSAITIAMICVALGFTCCENLVYIFIYNGSSLEMEIWVLIVRSFFPVHALTAAIQSLGVCERDLELSRTMKLGRIIWPAVLFHGGYDFVLLWLDFMADRKSSGDDDNDALESSGLVLLLAVILSVLAMVIAFVYYLKASRKQRARLISMDRQDAASRSSLI